MTCDWGSGFKQEIRCLIAGSGINCGCTTNKKEDGAKTPQEETMRTSHLSDQSAVSSSQDPTMKELLPTSR